MIPYRISVLAPNGDGHDSHAVKLFSTYAGGDDEALRIVSDVMPDGWRVDRVVGLLSRAEVERLRLIHGEVREVSSFAVHGPFVLEDALYASTGAGQPAPL